MPEEKKTYIVDNTPVDVDVKDVQSFLKYNPNAKEAKSFVVGNDTVDVMVEDLDGFLKNVPNAKPLFAETKSSPKKGVEEVISNFGTGFLGKQSAVPSPSVSGGSAMKEPSKAKPSTSQPRKPSEAEEAVMSYGLPKTIKIGAGKKKEAEEELRLPTEAEFATIEKMPLTKEAKLKEAVRLGTPPVERATQDIKTNKGKILSSEEELNKLDKELATYKQQSDSLLAIYDNEQLSPEERNKAGQEYNKVNEVAKPIEDRRNELYGNYQGYINNQKVLFNELDKAEKMRQKGLEKEYSYVQNLFEATGSYSVKALTGLGKMSHMISSLIPNFGLMTPEEERAGKMVFDASLGEINKFADSLITQEVPENYKKLFDGEFSAGKLAYITSNAIASTIPTIAAGLLSGGAGSVMVGAGMGFDESKSIMKDAGLTDEQADWAAFGLAIPIGFLEKYGADDAVRLLNGSKIRREVATELAKKFAGKTLTREAIYLETKKTFGEVIKGKVAKVLKEGGKESITEMAQGELVEGVKQAVQEFTGVDKDENMSTVDYLKQQLMQRGEEGVGGFLGGTSMQGAGLAFNTMLNKQEFSPSAYTKAMEFADPAKFQQFQNDLMLEVQNGVLTEEQANNAIANVQAIQETNTLIPNSVQNLDLRTEAVNLIIEKNNIAKEIEGKDPDLIAPENARLAEIKKALNDIAMGNKPGAEEQKVKTLEDDIEVGDTVDLTPKSTALKADIEERRAAELEPINLAIAESERTGEVPVVDGEPVNKKTIDDINAKYDAQIDALNKPAPTAESQPQAEATTEENQGNVEFNSDAVKFINETRNYLLSDIEYYKQIIEEDKPKTIRGKLARALIYEKNNNIGGYKKALSEAEADLNELDANPIEYFKRKKESTLSEETQQYFQNSIDYLEQNRITPQAQAAPQTLQEVTNKIAQLRAEEKAEYENLANPNNENLQEIYDRYDEIITPLLEQEKELKAQAPVAEEAKPTEEFYGYSKENPKIAENEEDAIELDEITPNSYYEKISGRSIDRASKTGKAWVVSNQVTGEVLFKGSLADAKSFLQDDNIITGKVQIQEKETAPTSEQAPESFPAQEGAESVEDKFQANSELEQIYRDLNAAVTKNVDKDTIRILKANPTEAMVNKVMETLKKKGIIEVDCN